MNIIIVTFPIPCICFVLLFILNYENTFVIKIKNRKKKI